MCNCCYEESCSRPGVLLCEGHLQSYVLTILANVFDESAVQLMRDLAVDQEEE